jgi:transcriptional regulator with XRE-family HTH domain
MKNVMTGQFVKEKLENAGLPLAEVARRMNVSPQTLNERLNVKDVKVGALTEIAKAVGKNLYYFLEDYDDVKGMAAQEQIYAFGTGQAQSQSQDKKYEKILKAKDETIDALKQTIAVYEKLLLERHN